MNTVRPVLPGCSRGPLLMSSENVVDCYRGELLLNKNELDGLNEILNVDGGCEWRFQSLSPPNTQTSPTGSTTSKKLTKRREITYTSMRTNPHISTSTPLQHTPSNTQLSRPSSHTLQQQENTQSPTNTQNLSNTQHPNVQKSINEHRQHTENHSQSKDTNNNDLLNNLQTATHKQQLPRDDATGSLCSLDHLSSSSVAPENRQELIGVCNNSVEKVSQGSSTPPPGLIASPERRGGNSSGVNDDTEMLTEEMRSVEDGVESITSEKKEVKEGSSSTNDIHTHTSAQPNLLTQNLIKNERLKVDSNAYKDWWVAPLYEVIHELCQYVPTPFNRYGEEMDMSIVGKLKPFKGIGLLDVLKKLDKEEYGHVIHVLDDVYGVFTLCFRVFDVSSKEWMNTQEASQLFDKLIRMRSNIDTVVRDYRDSEVSNKSNIMTSIEGCVVVSGGGADADGNSVPILPQRGGSVHTQQSSSYTPLNGVESWRDILESNLLDNNFEGLFGKKRKKGGSTTKYKKNTGGSKQSGDSTGPIHMLSGVYHACIDGTSSSKKKKKKTTVTGGGTSVISSTSSKKKGGKQQKMMTGGATAAGVQTGGMSSSPSTHKKNSERPVSTNTTKRTYNTKKREKKGGHTEKKGSVADQASSTNISSGAYHHTLPPPNIPSTSYSYGHTYNTHFNAIQQRTKMNLDAPILEEDQLDFQNLLSKLNHDQHFDLYNQYKHKAVWRTLDNGEVELDDRSTPPRVFRDMVVWCRMQLATLPYLQQKHTQQQHQNIPSSSIQQHPNSTHPHTYQQQQQQQHLNTHTHHNQHLPYPTTHTQQQTLAQTHIHNYSPYSSDSDTDTDSDQQNDSNSDSD